GQAGRLVPQTPVVAADVGFRIIDESVALLERLATDRPVVVAFEDLHWADPSTLRAVRAIGRALPDLPVALLVTLRPFPERSELAQVIDELVRHGAAALALEALDHPTVIALAEAVAGAPPGTVLSGQLAGTAGNPLFVIELIKALREQGSLTLRQGRADVADRSLPQTLRLTILRRVRGLAPQTLEVLRVAAVLGAGVLGARAVHGHRAERGRAAARARRCGRWVSGDGGRGACPDRRWDGRA
ncbi:MAG: hypothetical protein ACRDTZ_14780, partial [Pseudonocardiaceae bacterium]